MAGCGLLLNPSSDSGAGLIGYVGCNSLGDGHGVILKTGDGGLTWTRVSSSELPDVDLCQVRAIDKLNALAAGSPDGGYGVILKTTDGGATWTRLGSAASIPNVEFSSIAAVNTQIAWVVGSNATILKTTDGGTAWHRSTTPVNAGFRRVSFVGSRQ